MGKLGRGSEDKVKPVLKKGLKDSHPYVRSEAVSGLAFLKITDAIPDMMPLLDDSEKNTYNISSRISWDKTTAFTTTVQPGHA